MCERVGSSGDCRCVQRGVGVCMGAGTGAYSGRLLVRTDNRGEYPGDPGRYESYSENM